MVGSWTDDAWVMYITDGWVDGWMVDGREMVDGWMVDSD
jgi:hypothetical protein